LALSQVCPRDPGLLQPWIPGTRPGTSPGIPSKAVTRVHLGDPVSHSLTWASMPMPKDRLETTTRSLQHCGCPVQYMSFELWWWGGSGLSPVGSRFHSLVLSTPPDRMERTMASEHPLGRMTLQKLPFHEDVLYVLFAFIIRDKTREGLLNT
jgi:hypothetical protein